MNSTKPNLNEIPKFKDLPNIKNEVKQAFSKNSQFRELDFELETDPEESFRYGEPGFMDAMDSIQELVDNGYGVVDVMLAIGEEYPREEATRILDEARELGLL